jgi:hypothetical protein
VLGYALHLVPGCGHSHSGHLCGIHASACREHSNRDGTAIGNSDSDCAICRFLAIPRALTAPPAVAACGLYVDSRAATAPLQPDEEGARPYGARAPPRVSLIG